MTAIVSKHGELLFQISGSDETIQLNTLKIVLRLKIHPKRICTIAMWIEIPQQPSEYHIFDFKDKEW